MTQPPVNRQLHLALFVSHAGTHLAGWRLPEAETGNALDIRWYQQLAQKAEAARLDMLFVADKLALDDIHGGSFDAAVSWRPNGSPEPLALLSALSVLTSHIGLGATISTSYHQPYHAARQFATLDHFSGGRAAWNAVTSVNDGEARNFGFDQHLGHAERYAKAAEFLDVVRGLWDSWQDEAIVADKASGRYADASKLHYLNHDGEHFKVRGPLNLPRPPQGHPVLIQAGVSAAFQSLAAQNAEVVFPVQSTLEKAQAFYRIFKQQVVDAGRQPDDVKVLPGLYPIIADTDQQAHELAARLDESILPIAGLAFMSASMNYDLARHDPTAPVPDIREQIRGSKGRFDVVIGNAIEAGWTLEQLGRWYASSLAFAKFIGSPQTVADQMQQWLEQNAADGFVIMAPYMPGGAERFLEQVVPELQRRGLFRTEYQGTTLREHLGLRKPQRLNRASQ
ncbi:LLM class flavin-dependent oxidoreductase [Pseudomonas sp. 21LCFQ02]|uniref:LLM class flavin-dependent oxidoreductase n=1 Tax=unclassified Pseudomonas TaxID=196821 RepID=UPI0004F689E9|nr:MULTISPECIES: LLM class flavin-dependent oxidoreductase [unclassified Pseudomonas]MCO8170739.1 LLM class flavin-dependent oxidoreductase [Pseudomonas sp. 21LCFQ02]MCQ9427369.1 LLM class flavin-dependent oxidoreductase [Pseudomonas sp. LJDD11]BAP45716.1 nitrilotriacetate monooxygenase [Pseudomonas sp. StFLB209]